MRRLEEWPSTTKFGLQAHLQMDSFGVLFVRARCACKLETMVQSIHG
jgi:hypothetical protein